MIYLKCPTCRTILGNKEVPYREGLKKINEKNLSNKEKEKEVFELLKSLEVDRMCCRMRINQCISMIDLIKYVPPS